MKKIRVMQVITGLNVGGAEKVVFDLAKDLSNKNVEVVVVCLSNKHKLLDQFLEAGIETITLDMKKDPFSIANGVRAMSNIIAEKQIDIIHAHMTHALIMSCLLRIMNCRLKLVYTSHNSNLGSKVRELVIWASKSLRNKDILFSASMKRSIYKKYDSIVIPNGIQTSLYKVSTKKNDVFTFLAIGRLEPVKNHRLLIDAASILKNLFDFRIDIVGEGVLMCELKEYAKAKSVSDIVNFLGYRADVNVICNKSHVFVLPSYWEGLPISLLEAGASSLPVICTPVGSIPDVVSGNEGYLIDLDGFIKMMKTVYDNYPEALKKGSLLQEKIVKYHDLDSIANRHRQLYSDLTSMKQ